MSEQILHYLTSDALNAETAEALAHRHGFTLEVVDPRDLPRLAHDQSALIVDWDYLTEDDRAKLLNRALNVVAIHGFNLSDSLASFLPRSQGIICSRRLDDHLFAALAHTARAA